jgi:putative chitinase
MQLTIEQLQAVSGCTKAKAEEWLPYVNEILPKFDINSRSRIAAFFAQVGHESASLAFLEENLNYSKEALARVWPNRYSTVQNGVKVPNSLAKSIERNPRRVGSNVYANRMGNGSEASGDGYLYRGRGALQTTGKTNYTQLQKETGLPVLTKPEILTTPTGALISACFFWSKNNLNRLADAGKFDYITKVINGGTHGIEDRRRRYAKALAAIPE